LASSCRATRWRPLASIAVVVTLAACSTSTSPSASDPSAVQAEDAEVAPVDDARVTAEVDGDDLVVVTPDGSTTVATIEGGELVHAAVRPGTTEPLTVLAVARAEGRYELRYVNVIDGEPTDLYWFPFRMQVDEDSTSVSDVPPLPVWSPDGDAVAWIEWDQGGTRLRTVGWLDHSEGTNPSEEQATYELDDVPVGTQLESWELDEDGTPVLTAEGDGSTRWRIRLEGDGPVEALAAV
jgi:hypothetical protein